MLLQQNPIVVEVGSQPAPTPEISYVSVLGSAVMMVGVILVTALVVGVAVGWVIIRMKKRRERQTDTTAPSHVRLQI